MKKLKLASFISLFMPFAVIGISYAATLLLTYNWALTLLTLLALLLAMPLFGIVALVLDAIVINKEGFGFVSFNLLVLSVIELAFGAFCLFQVFFVRYY